MPSPTFVNLNSQPTRPLSIALWSSALPYWLVNFKRIFWMLWNQKLSISLTKKKKLCLLLLQTNWCLCFLPPLLQSFSLYPSSFLCPSSVQSSSALSSSKPLRAKLTTLMLTAHLHSFCFALLNLRNCFPLFTSTFPSKASSLQNIIASGHPPPLPH